MAELVSDEEDDELSKKAFTTLEDMEKSGADGLYPLIMSLGECMRSLVSPNDIDISTVAARQYLFPSAPTSSPCLDLGQFTQLMLCKQKLGKYLPILNGLIYMNEGTLSDCSTPLVAVRMHVLMQYGLKELMGLLSYVPLCIVPQILYIVSNLTIDKRLGKATTLVVAP